MTNIGNSISINVQFSEPISVTQGGPDPSLNLNSGATASYNTWDNTDTFTFTYTIGAGEDSSGELDVTQFNPGGWTITDSAGNSADYTLPAAGAAGSLSANNNIIVDTIPPTVTNVTSTTLDGYYNAGNSINVRVRFSENISLSGTTTGSAPRILIDFTGTDQYFGYSSAGANYIDFSYTVQNGDNSPDLDYVNTSSLELNGSTITDLAGNTADLTLPSPGAPGSLSANKNIVIDTIAPNLISAETIDNDKDGRLDHYKLTFDENILDSSYDPTDFTIDGGSYTTGAISIIDDSANDQVLYIQTSGSGSPDTGITPDITTSGIGLTDLAGNILNDGNDYAAADISEKDTAAPVIIQAVTYDSDKNGFIDRIEFELSESINDNFNPSNFDISGYTGETFDTTVEALSGGNSDQDENDNRFSITFTESTTYDTDNTPSYTYTPNPQVLRDLNNNYLESTTGTAVDRAGPVLLTARYNDIDNNGIEQGDTITLGFTETVKLGCIDSSDFVLLNPGDTFGTGSYLEDTSSDTYINIVLGTEPSFILPGQYSNPPSSGNPSGIGIKEGGTTCLTDLSGNGSPSGPIADIGGKGANAISSVSVTDGSKIFILPDQKAVLLDTDIYVNIKLHYSAAFVRIFYDVGKEPDGDDSTNPEDRAVIAEGSSDTWIATIPGTDDEIVEGATVLFIIEADGMRFYSDGEEGTGSKPYEFKIIVEQKDRVTIRNNIINPSLGEITYLDIFIDKATKVKAIIYDISGNPVKTLNNKTLQPGAHLLTWDGKNQKGKKVVPGVYYILIKVGKKRYIKKVLIVR